MGAYDRLQAGLFVMSQGDRESKRHGHGPAPEYKGETAPHAMTMPPFYMVAQLKYTGTGFTKQTSSRPARPAAGCGAVHADAEDLARHCAESILCALRLSEDDRDLQALRFHAKTAARNN